MSTTVRLPILALLCGLFALPGCQMSEPPARQPAAPVAKPPPSMERVPPPAAAAGGQPNLALSSGRGRPGTTFTVTATLTTTGARVAGTQNDITYDPKQLAIAQTSAGKPDCHANSQLGKEGTAFNFQPPGCHGTSCNSVRALVLSLSNVDAIPSGSALYTCSVQIAPTAHAGTERLALSRVGFSDPAGKAVSGGGTDGSITIEP